MNGTKQRENRINENLFIYNLYPNIKIDYKFNLKNV